MCLSACEINILRPVMFAIALSVLVAADRFVLRVDVCIGKRAGVRERVNAEAAHWTTFTFAH